MPRPVVPMLASPRALSRSRSSAPCSGRISAAFSASSRLAGVTSTPCLRSASISAISAQGSTTTPLPMTESLPLRTTPEGSRLSLYVLPLMTSVWPALWPPWKRTTTSARSDSQSTILPLPSSPHWTPTTATLAIALPLQRDGAAGAHDVAAAEPARLGLGLRRGIESGDRDPAFGPPAPGVTCRRVGRNEQAPRYFRRRQGAKQPVHVKGESRRGFSLGADVASAPAELGPGPPREECEADAAVIFQAAMLRRIDGQRQFRTGPQHEIDHLAEPFPLGRGRLGQDELRQRRHGFARRSRCRQQGAEGGRLVPRQLLDRAGVAPVEGIDQRFRGSRRKAEAAGQDRHQAGQIEIDGQALDADRIQRLGRQQ